MNTVGAQVQATLDARDLLVERFGGPVDLDLVEVLADAILNNDQSQKDLVFVVGCQRETRAREALKEGNN